MVIFIFGRFGLFDLMILIMFDTKHIIYNLNFKFKGILNFKIRPSVQYVHVYIRNASMIINSNLDNLLTKCVIDAE